MLMTKAAAKALAIVSVTLAGILAVVIVWYGPTINSADNNARGVREANEISGCRSVYRSELDTAYSMVQDLILQGNQVVLEGLAAVALDDDGALLALEPRAQAVQALTVPARAQVGVASETYKRAVAFSNAEPDHFLELCRTGGEIP